jgi:NDP-sugar pyrophosphorylase family protein
MLMAAGLGTRLTPFTDVTPQAVLPVLSVPMAAFPMATAAAAGVKRIVANVHHLPGIARAGISGAAPKGVEVLFSDESSQLLGSAGGIRQALSLLGGEAFFLLNADVLCQVDLGALAARHRELRRRHGVQLTMAIFTGPPGGRYRELMLDPAGERVIGFSPDLRESRPFFAGAAVLEPEAVIGLTAGQPEEFVPRIMEPALRQGKVGVFRGEGLWMDVGSPELWRQAHLGLMTAVEQGRVPEEWTELISRSAEPVPGASPGIWRAKGSLSDGKLWSGPCYWGGTQEQAPKRILAGSVLYSLAKDIERRSGISWSGLFSPAPNLS